MREIEIKVRLNDAPSILKKLAARGIEFSGAKTQHDVVYGPAGASGGSDQRHAWLRVRTQTQAGSETIFFTLKRSVTGQLDSIEHEVEINDADEALAICRQLGYELYSDLTKTRRTAHWQNMELCYDEIEGLGIFLEAERLEQPDADQTNVVEEMWAALEGFGITKADQVTDGYDVLMRRHLGLGA